MAITPRVLVSNTSRGFGHGRRFQRADRADAGVVDRHVNGACLLDYCGDAGCTGDVDYWRISGHWPDFCVRERASTCGAMQ